MGKEKLIKDLSSLNYRVNIKVNKKAKSLHWQVVENFLMIEVLIQSI